MMNIEELIKNTSYIRSKWASSPLWLKILFILIFLSNIAAFSIPIIDKLVDLIPAFNEATIKYSELSSLLMDGNPNNLPLDIHPLFLIVTIYSLNALLCILLSLILNSNAKLWTSFIDSLVISAFYILIIFSTLNLFTLILDISIIDLDYIIESIITLGAIITLWSAIKSNKLLAKYFLFTFSSIMFFIMIATLFFYTYLSAAGS